MELFYRSYGDGPPLVILHGLYGSSDNWVSIARQLSEYYSVFLPDIRNHGRSPHHKEHTYESMTKDIEAFVKNRIKGRFTLVGHSMGGKTAISYALKNPDAINALIVADISPFKGRGAALATEIHKKILDTIINADLSLATTRADVKRLLLSAEIDKRTAEFLMKNINRKRDGKFEWRINAEALLNNLNNIMNTIPGDYLHRGPVSGFPVLFIRGGESGYLPDSHIKKLESLFPTYSVETIAGAGHWLHAEKPDAFIAAIERLMEGGY